MSSSLDQYTDRKTHDCGCVTVWDEQAGPCFVAACGVHRRYAHRYPAEQEPELLEKA